MLILFFLDGEPDFTVVGVVDCIVAVLKVPVMPISCAVWYRAETKAAPVGQPWQECIGIYANSLRRKAVCSREIFSSQAVTHKHDDVSFDIRGNNQKF